MIFKQEDGFAGNFLAGGLGIPVLIQSSSGFDAPCDASTAWREVINLQNIGTSLDANLLPVQFIVQIPGTYLISYNLTFSLVLDDGIANLLYRFNLQTQGPILIPGSQSQVTIPTDGSRVHISHSVTYSALAGDTIGVFSEIIGSLAPICTNFHDGSFAILLLQRNDIIA
jgi:hypothetical protein